MNEVLQSFVIGTAGLSVLAVGALVIASVRGPVPAAGIPPVRALCWVGLSFHAAHCTEEAWTGFPEQFPGLLGLAPWPLSLFLGFNLSCLLLWVACVGSVGRHRLAAAAIWFFALASVVNGLFHPAVAGGLGRYFPGLWTSPVVGVVGVLLVRRLGAGGAGPLAPSSVGGEGAGA